MNTKLLCSSPLKEGLGEILYKNTQQNPFVHEKYEKHENIQKDTISDRLPKV
jgi:hypothetical protein